MLIVSHIYFQRQTAALLAQTGNVSQRTGRATEWTTAGTSATKCAAKVSVSTHAHTHTHLGLLVIHLSSFQNVGVEVFAARLVCVSKRRRC